MKKLIELNQFIHALEKEVLLPMFHTKQFSQFVSGEELSNHCCKNTWTTKGQIIGCVLFSTDIIAINYFGYIKKSFGLLSSYETQSNVPTLIFEKIPENVIYKYSSSRKLACSYRNNVNVLKQLMKGII